MRVSSAHALRERASHTPDDFARPRVPAPFSLPLLPLTADSAPPPSTRAARRFPPAVALPGGGGGGRSRPCGTATPGAYRTPTKAKIPPNQAPTTIQPPSFNHPPGSRRTPLPAQPGWRGRPADRPAGWRFRQPPPARRDVAPVVTWRPGGGRGWGGCGGKGEKSCERHEETRAVTGGGDECGRSRRKPNKHTSIRVCMP
jgi:hypothetical protein